MPSRNFTETQCNKCKNKTSHTIQYSSSKTEDLPSSAGNCSKKVTVYQVLSCRGCSIVTFRIEHNDYIRTDSGKEECRKSEELYPGRENGRNPINEYSRFPDTTQKIYLESITAFNRRLSILTGIGIRSIIESICQEKECTGSNLQKQIDDLENKGLLSTEQVNTLHKLRIMGNKAAHDSTPPTNEQLTLAMDIAEHLLREVYILPYHVKNNFK